MEEAAVDACEIARLPEEIVSATLARAGPREACGAAVVSPAFRAAADSDAVWACFLPRDLPPIADGELPAAPPLSKKELFLRLSNSPVLLPDRLVSLWLDKETGAKCYMLSARQLYIVWSDTPRYWTWIPLTDSRFSEGAQLLDVCWLEIRGKIQSKMLSENSTYAAYLVYKIDTEFYGLDSPVQEASVSIGETKLTRQVCVQDYDDEDREIPENYRVRPSVRFMTRRRNRRVVPPGENAQLPHKRTNGWMELELGEFFNEGGEDGEVSVDLTETKGGNWKKGLIVQGVEIRVKKSG